jgi:YD repeat-containing protein
LVTAATNPAGVQTQYDYDPFGRLLEVAYPGDTLNSPTMWYAYYDYGQTQFLAPFLVATFYKNDLLDHERRFYDGFGRLVQEQQRRYHVQGLGEQDIVTTYGYDARGLQVCQSLPYAVTPYSGSGTPFKTTPCTGTAHTAQDYNPAGRLESITTPDGATTSYVYGVTTNITAFGYNRLWRTQTFDANNHVVNRFTNSFGELVLVRENTGSNPYTQYADTRYEYDTVGNLVEVLTSTPSDSQPGSWLRRITMGYNPLGQKTAMSDPDMGSWAYGYSPAGNLSRQVDGRGRVLCFSYDAHNRLGQKFEDVAPGSGCPASPAAADVVLAEYGYDNPAVNGEGQVTRINWSDDTTNNYETFSYDNEGRLSSHFRKINGRPYTLATESYDTLDRPLRVDYPASEDLIYTYDQEGVEQMQFQVGSTTTNLISYLSYTARGQLAVVQRAGAVPDTGHGYHGPGENFRLSQITHGTASDAFPDYTYSNYDPVGNLLSMTIDHSGSGADVVHTYTYDALNRLATAKAQVGTNPAQYNYTYSYDILGNIDQRTGTGGTWDYEYHATLKQRLMQVTGYGLSVTGYNANGGLTSYQIGSTPYTLVYDAENRLTSVTVGSQTTHFFYDANGQRVRTLYPNGTNVYTPFPEYEETVSGSTVTKRSNYYLNGQLAAFRVVTGSTAAHYFTLADHLGNISAISDSGGTFYNGSYAQYKPFGAYHTEPTTNPGLTD